jgi:hypothetical protein
VIAGTTGVGKAVALSSCGWVTLCGAITPFIAARWVACQQSGSKVSSTNQQRSIITLTHDFITPFDRIEATIRDGLLVLRAGNRLSPTI